jgi:6-phosphogluconolactonase/glucosamine-6-phosphate isomerase/deaminase
METRIASSSEVSKAAADFLTETFKAQAGREFLFLSSGGSSLKLLDLIDTQYFGTHATITVLDERFSTDPTLNNMALVESTVFYKKVKELGAHFIDTKVLGDETMEEMAATLEGNLREWISRTNGTIIATVGVGPDTHTSGVMPYPEDAEFFNDTFNNEDRWVAAYDAKDKNPERLRITCTIPFFRKIHLPVLFITGENKRHALEILNAKDGSTYKNPCRIWREVPNAILFTDQTLQA